MAGFSGARAPSSMKESIIHGRARSHAKGTACALKTQACYCKGLAHVVGVKGTDYSQAGLQHEMRKAVECKHLWLGEVLVLRHPETGHTCGINGGMDKSQRQRPVQQIAQQCHDDSVVAKKRQSLVV